VEGYICNPRLRARIRMCDRRSKRSASSKSSNPSRKSVHGAGEEGGRQAEGRGAELAQAVM